MKTPSPDSVNLAQLQPVQPKASGTHPRQEPALPAFLDARTVPSGTTLTPDLVIVGSGPAGISLALALANAPIKILLLESGGLEFEQATQKLYSGPETGNVKYNALDACRLRMFGGASNHWGGWTRPLDPSDFAKRDWLPYSGWPISYNALAKYFPRAQELIEAGPVVFDYLKHEDSFGPPIALGKGGVYQSFFQFSKTNDSDLPTPFGHRYGDDLKKQANLQIMLHANVTGLRLAADARTLDHLDVAALNGKKITVKPKHAVVACGAIENARLLLASNDVMKTGVGNVNDLVGRFFADHAIPRDTANLALFNGQIPAYWKTTIDMQGTHARATFSPTEDFKNRHHILGSLTTVENHIDFDDLTRAAIGVTASALGVDAANAKAWSMGCGIELAPDPDRRVTLTSERDALGMPRLKLDMRISDDDFARYRLTMKELGRQLLESKAGLVRLNRQTRDEWLETMDWGNHHLGTARMSDDPKSGVVDANLKVHGIANLFVAGSSAFPTYGSSNPTMNLVALTLRLADHVKGLFG
jgi:choline dehydrogenase-like flavoprotein